MERTLPSVRIELSRLVEEFDKKFPSDSFESLWLSQYVEHRLHELNLITNGE